MIEVLTQVMTSKPDGRRQAGRQEASGRSFVDTHTHIHTHRHTDTHTQSAECSVGGYLGKSSSCHSSFTSMLSMRRVTSAVPILGEDGLQLTSDDRHRGINDKQRFASGKIITPPAFTQDYLQGGGEAEGGSVNQDIKGGCFPQ